ncbi:hypothetical protein [Plantactinospora sp. GCM10030261]|uniref:hypothetical protein n=1 Tax=Plantactinospora sp. GCM10030261 TaxID=3273420 RepID=UPI0036098C3A
MTQPTPSGSVPSPTGSPASPSPSPVELAPVSYEGQFSIDERTKDLDLDPPARAPARNGGDLLWDENLGLRATDGVKIGLWRDREQPTYEQCSVAARAAALTRAELDEGHVACVRTNGGGVARLRVTSVEDRSYSFTATIWRMRED